MLLLFMAGEMERCFSMVWLICDEGIGERDLECDVEYRRSSIM